MALQQSPTRALCDSSKNCILWKGVYLLVSDAWHQAKENIYCHSYQGLALAIVDKIVSSSPNISLALSQFPHIWHITPLQGQVRRVWQIEHAHVRRIVKGLATKAGYGPSPWTQPTSGGRLRLFVFVVIARSQVLRPDRCCAAPLCVCSGLHPRAMIALSKFGIWPVARYTLRRLQSQERHVHQLFWRLKLSLTGHVSTVRAVAISDRQGFEKAKS